VAAGSALRTPRAALSSAQLDGEAADLRARLQGRALIVARVTGEPIADAAAIRAARRAGASLVLVDGRLREHEVARRLEACGAARLIEDDLTTSPLPGAGVDPVPSLHVFTSGTSGPPHPVALPWTLLERSADAVAEAVELRAGDLWACPLPVAHVGGVGVLLRCWRTGATPWLLPDAEPTRLADALARASHASVVARSLARLLHEVPTRPLSRTLRRVMVGGGRTDPELVRRAREAGLPAVTSFGLTEAGSTVTLHRLDGLPTGPGDAGWPLPHVGLRLDDDGALHVRPAGGTERATGDFARVDPDGRLVLLDRRSDRIVTGGENVSPAEVEDVLDRCPGVAESCVVGLADPDWGQRVAAAVRWTGPSDPARLAAWAEEHLAPWQRPKEQHPWPSPLPRNALGKLLRREVRAELSAARRRPG